MAFLPIVQRELVVSGRKGATYWSRVASAGIALLFFVTLAAFDHSPPARLGPRILYILSIFIFLECIIAGLRYTCDALSEERREGTLGLLFLTGLNGWDVVLGKMISRSIGSAYNLLAVIPIYALSLLLGGVNGGQVAALSMAFLVSMVFSLSAGIFISNRGTGEREVLFRTLRLIAAFTLLPPIVYAAVAKITGQYVLLDTLLYLSPAYAFREASIGFRPGFQASAAVLLALSAGMIAWTALTLRRNLSRETAAAQPRPARFRRSRWVRDGLLRTNPALWLFSRDPFSRRTVFTLSLLAGGFGLFSRIALEASWNAMIPIVVFGSYGMHALVKFLLVIESARHLTEDRRSGALELILSTPLPPARLIGGQLQATRTAWLPLVIAVAIMNLTWMTEEDFLEDVGIFLPVSLVLLWSDSRTLPWVALRNSLRGWKLPRVIFRAFFGVMALPILLLLLILFIGEGSGLSKDEVLSFVFFWGVGSVIYNTVLQRRARRELIDFRRLAAGEETRERRLARALVVPPALIRARGDVSAAGP